MRTLTIRAAIFLSLTAGSAPPAVARAYPSVPVMAISVRAFLTAFPPPSLLK
jgi:hypothetical protein